MALHPADQVCQVGLDRVALQGVVHLPGHAAQFPGLFHQGDVKAGLGDGQGRGHAGQPAADHQGFLGNLERHLMQGILFDDPGHGHGHQLFGLVGGGFRKSADGPRSPGPGYWPYRRGIY